jgi:hypothetical protein
MLDATVPPHPSDPKLSSGRDETPAPIRTDARDGARSAREFPMKTDGHPTQRRHGMLFRRLGAPLVGSGTEGEWVVVALGLSLLALALGAGVVPVVTVLGLLLAILWVRRHPEAQPDAARAAIPRGSRRGARGEHTEA